MKIREICSWGTELYAFLDILVERHVKNGFINRTDYWKTFLMLQRVKNDAELCEQIII